MQALLQKLRLEVCSFRGKRQGSLSLTDKKILTTIKAYKLRKQLSIFYNFFFAVAIKLLCFRSLQRVA